MEKESKKKPEIVFETIEKFKLPIYSQFMQKVVEGNKTLYVAESDAYSETQFFRCLNYHKPVSKFL
jgi:hypothetical protein